MPPVPLLLVQERPHKGAHAGTHGGEALPVPALRASLQQQEQSQAASCYPREIRPTRVAVKNLEVT